jgi:hypothetical protein
MTHPRSVAGAFHYREYRCRHLAYASCIGAARSVAAAFACHSRKLVWMKRSTLPLAWAYSCGASTILAARQCWRPANLWVSCCERPIVAAAPKCRARESDGGRRRKRICWSVRRTPRQYRHRVGDRDQVPHCCVLSTRHAGRFSWLARIGLP